jgi:hypothetical protein
MVTWNSGFLNESPKLVTHNIYQEVSLCLLEHLASFVVVIY